MEVGSAAWIKYFVQNGGDLPRRSAEVCPCDVGVLVYVGLAIIAGAHVVNFDPMVLSLDEDIVLANSFGASLNI